MRMIAVDIHTHYPFTKGMVTNKRNLRFLETAGVPFPEKADISDLITAMDKGGVAVSCLMGPNPAEGICYTNDMLFEAVSGYPARLIAFGGLDPEDTKAELGKQIDRLIDNYGFKGIGEMGGYDLLTPQCRYIYEACISRDIPVLIHSGIPLPAMYMKHCHPHAIDEVAIQYPDLKIIMAHGGFPWVMEALAVVMRHENVFVDISNLTTVSEIVFKAVLYMFIGSKLHKKILFGTDFPGNQPDKYMKIVKGLRINPLLRWLIRTPEVSGEMLSDILGGNAVRLLKINK